MTWWHNLKARWPGGLRQHVTRSGLAYTATILVVALAAFVSANNLLFLILAAMLSVLLVSGFVSKLGLAGLEIDLTLPEHISARRKVRAGVRLKNLKRWTPSFSIRVAGTLESGFDSSVYFPVIPGGTTLEEPVDLYFPKRGLWRERSFQFTTRFPFGFAERREFVTTRHEIVVYPCLDPSPEFETLLASVTGDLEARQRGRSHDFYRIRPYEALESARHVDWRRTPAPFKCANLRAKRTTTCCSIWTWTSRTITKPGLKPRWIVPRSSPTAWPSVARACASAPRNSM